MKRKSGPSDAQMEKKKARGKRNKSPELPPPKRGKTNQTALPNQACAWKASKLMKTKIQALADAGVLQEKALAGWSAATGDAWPFQKNPDETPMFAHFYERGLALPTSDFFRGMVDFYKIEHAHLNPNGIFHIAMFVHLCEAFLVIRPHWALFRKLFRLKPQPNKDNPFVVGGSLIQMR
jgi:hypothetical protein